MSGLFPNSGVPASDAKNSIPNVDVVPGCDQLWYSTSRCTPRFDSAAMNAVLAELFNAIMGEGGTYDCSRFDNLAEALKRPIINGTIPPVITNLATGNHLDALQETVHAGDVQSQIIVNPSATRPMRVTFHGAANCSGSVSVGGITILGRVNCGDGLGWRALSLGGTITTTATSAAGGSEGAPYFDLPAGQSRTVQSAIYFVGGVAGGTTAGTGIDAVGYVDWQGIAVDIP